MRDIKFKYYYRNSEGHTISKVFDMDSDIANGAHWGYISDCPLMKDYKILDRVQYTGLKDRKGVEIYEGDIVKVTDDYDSGFIGNVRFGAFGYPAFEIYRGRDVYSDDYNTFTNDCDLTFEVIGNIHQNHELLESDK